MTLRSSSSFRISDDPDLAPPTKRQRLLHHYYSSSSTTTTTTTTSTSSTSSTSSSSSSRRKSSPDLLSDNTENNRKSPHLSRHANPRSQPRRPPPDTPRTRTPASATKLLLRDGRESPDPLDTISPCTPKTRPRTKSSVPVPPATVSGTSTATRSTRHSLLHNPPAVDNDSKNDADQKQTLAGSATSVANGLSPSVQPTQPAPSTKPPAVTERRSLRSHGASRSKSELASYFYNYEQILSLEPPKPEVLSGDTLVQLIDDLSEPLPLSRNSSSDDDDEFPFGNPLVHLNHCEEVELPEPDMSDDAEEDPLNEETFFRAHRRVERQEKQIRNIERERAQHEKLQLERLLDELQGHDWLRVMGVSGVTDSEKKLYEPKRDYFVKEVSALIDKFRVWKEEEKRRKLEKDRASSSRMEATPLEPKTESPKSETDEEEEQQQPRVNGMALLSSEETQSQSTADLLPDPNDVDAWAARQLHQEAARSATARKRPKTYTDGRRHHNTRPAGLVAKQSLNPPSPPSPDQPFTSFYSKKHLRDAAMSKHRRRGRVVSAFGHPIPDMEEREFALPSDILTEETIHACRRQRRRMKRQSHA